MYSRQQPLTDWSMCAFASGLSCCPRTDQKAAVAAAETLSSYWSSVSSLSQFVDAAFEIEMMPLAQNSREGEQGRLSPQDEEEEEEEEQTEVESFDASPAESAVSMQVFLW